MGVRGRRYGNTDLHCFFGNEVVLVHKVAHEGVTEEIRVLLDDFYLYNAGIGGGAGGGASGARRVGEVKWMGR